MRMLFWANPMRFRTLAFSFMTAIGLVALASSAYVWTKNMRRLGEVQEGRALVNLIGPTVSCIEKITTERGATTQAVLYKGLEPQKTRSLIAGNRAATDSLFALAERRAAELPADERAPVSDLIFRARNVINSARQEVDPYLADGAPPSDDASVGMVQRYGEANADVDAALANAEQRLARLDPMLASRIEVARLSDDIREEQGLRAATLTRFFALGKPFAPQERIEAAEDAGAVNISWRRLQQLAEEIGSPAISAGVEHVKSEFFDKGEPVYKAVTDAARVGAPAPMDILAWRQWVDANLSQSLAARDPAIGEISARLDQIRAEATFSSTLSNSTIAALLMILIWAGFYFETHVLRPICALTASLDSFADGDREGRRAADRDQKSLADRFAGRHDEIGSLAACRT